MKIKVLASCISNKKGNNENNLFDGGYYSSELSLDPKEKDFKALGDLKNDHKVAHQNQKLIFIGQLQKLLGFLIQTTSLQWLKLKMQRRKMKDTSIMRLNMHIKILRDLNTIS